ncbi:MAG: HAMP domain-containing histidine kinase [Coriobacteriia bacterium]|nr:HAMP domain-containing histidine kinase [Coriobacteriia bacterium]
MARPGMPDGLSARLALTFAAVAALTAALAAVILSVVWARQFDIYVREGLQTTADGAAELLADGYETQDGWTVENLAQMPRVGVVGGLALQVLDDHDRVIYDDTLHGGVMGGMMRRPVPTSREPQGPVVTSDVVVDGEIVGKVRVWSLSPRGLLTENDVRFQNSSFMGLAAAAAIAVVLASIAGVWFARQLVRPIDRVTATAAALRAGDKSARTGMTGDDAVGVLGRTFDEMADSIEAERQMERRLTADVAHELRTPLQAIQATVEAMQDGVLPADEERLAIVRDETVRLSRLADGILELTRLERGSVQIRLERVDLGTPVRTAVDAHRAFIETSGLTLAEDIADGLSILGDTDRLTQAVGNLLSNAARYTPDGGSVWVRAYADGDRAVVEVSDTGVGIAATDVDKVFRRFWRADEARDRATGGLGIGLAVVREVVDRHGGAVTVSSREGGGSSFAMRIPLAPRV